MEESFFASGNKRSIQALGRKGWFIGHFIQEDDLQYSADVEVKWANHVKGEANAGGFVFNRTAKTLSMLVSGRFRIILSPDSKAWVKEFELRDSGDYLLWSNLVKHTWIAIEDSVILTVRWPSVAEDQTIAT